jgi:DNA-binding PadR family transcriptional regulator
MSTTCIPNLASEATVVARVVPNHSFPKGGRKDREIPRTTPREQLVLFAIGSRTIYGLEIQKRIERTTSGQHKLSLGAIYPILQSLEQKGLIESEWGDETTCGARRRYHKCSDLGKAVIEDVIATQNRLLSDES